MTKQQVFIVDLAETLHKNGLPAHRIENSIKLISKVLQTPVELSSTPEMLMLSFDSTSHTTMKKMSGSSLNFDRMDHLHKLISEISNKNLDVESAQKQLNEIKNRKVLYNKWINILFIAISNSSSACLFGGGWAEIIVSGFIGIVIGLIIEVLSSFPNLARLSVLFSSAAAIFIAKSGVSLFGNYSVEIASITGLILLIPGFSFSQSVTELAHGQLVSMIYITPLKFHFPALPFWASYIAILVVPAGFGVLFNAKREHYIWMLVACTVSYFSMKYISFKSIPEFSVLFSAFLLGLISNSISFFLKKSSSLMLVPGIILLVPGSIGFKTVTYLMNEQTMSGLESAISTLITAVALTCGLLFSNMIIKQREVF
jgi:uncharacterized membrane protein YjjP (DUF1212 family)